MRDVELPEDPINARHRRLRGTNALRYPPDTEFRCQHTCGLLDLKDDSATEPADRRRSHRCFLYAHTVVEGGHDESAHEFSSECALSRFAAVGEVLKVKDAAA